eukprot:4044233-Pleurochrysis_carterae.AAC.2
MGAIRFDHRPLGNITLQATPQRGSTRQIRRERLWCRLYLHLMYPSTSSGVHARLCPRPGVARAQRGRSRSGRPCATLARAATAAARLGCAHKNAQAGAHAHAHADAQTHGRVRGGLVARG